MAEQTPDKSLDKLSSPEQLDRLLIIVRMPGWIALISIFLIILTILLWASFGRITISATGAGIFFKPESIQLIQSPQMAFVSTINVKQGSTVERDDVLIVLSAPEKLWEEQQLEEKIQVLERTIEEERKNSADRRAIELEKAKTILALEKKELERLGRGTNYELEIAIENQEATIRLLEEENPDGSLLTYILDLESLKTRRNLLENQIQSMTIRAPQEGTVMTIEVLPGEEVSVGKTLIWFQKQDNEKELVYTFFPEGSESAIRAGQTAHLQFSSASSVLYGKMIGKVTRIIPFTATAKGNILKSIPSEKVKAALTHEQATVIVEIEPVPAKTASGYAWTTSKGPPYPIAFGETALVEVHIAEKRPISYLIPLKNHL